MPVTIFASATVDKAKDTVYTKIWAKDENNKNVIDQVKFGFAEIAFKDRDPVFGYGAGNYGVGSYTDDNSFLRTFFDKSYADGEGKISVVFNHPLTILDLELHVTLEMDSTLTFDAIFPVLIETDKLIEKVKLIDQPFQPNELTARSRPLPQNTANSLPKPSIKELITQSKEVISSVSEITIRSLILDFALQTPFLKGSCTLDYLGGGNRLLEHKTIGKSGTLNSSFDRVTNSQKKDLIANKDQATLTDKSPLAQTILISQVKDEKPFLKDAKVFVESNATNLLPNPRFLSGTVSQPNGFSFVANNSVIARNATHSVSNLAKVWEVTVSDTRFGGEEVFFQPNTSVIIDSARPLTLSTYLDIISLAADSILSKIKLMFYFRDINDVLLGTKVEEFDPVKFIHKNKPQLKTEAFNQFQQISSSIHPSEYPPNTEKIFWQIGFSEVNRADGFIFMFFLPQLEQTKTSTTSVEESKTRLADTLTVKQANCLQLDTGEISLSFIANHTSPLFDTYFFDTRHPVTLLNGFAAWHEAGSNLIKFSVANGATNQVIQSDGPVTLIQGSRIDMRVKWIDAVREIWMSEEDQVVMNLDPYTTPTVNNDDIFIGSDSMKTPSAYLNSEIKEFRISKFLLSQFSPIP